MPSAGGGPSPLCKQPGHSQAGSTRNGKTTGKQEKKTNPKVLSSHKMRGGKSHPTPHPQPIQRVPVTPHLRLPPASIRGSSGSWDVRRGLHMEGLAGVGEGGGASPLNSQLTADQSN